MTLATAKARVKAYVEARLPDLVDFQRDFHAANGRYCQFLLTHASTPDGDVDETPDRLDVRPSDAQGDPTWRQMRKFLRWTGNAPEKCPAAIRVDEHGEDKDGNSNGWSLVAVLKRPANSHWRIWGRAGASSKPWDIFDAKVVGTPED